MRKGYLRAHVTVALVLGIISTVLGLGSFGITFYQTTYSTNVDVGKSFNYSLKAGQYSQVSIAPACGKLYLGYVQKSGAVSGSKRTKYRAYYRPTNSSAWRPVCKWRKGMRTSQTVVFTPGKNKRHSSMYLVDFVDGHKKYLFKWQKIKGSRKSKGTVDIMLE